MATDSEATQGTQASQAEGSNSGAGQQGSEQEYVTVAKFNEIVGKLDLIARQAQSDKDRAVKKTNQRLDSLEGDLKQVLRVAAKEGKGIQDVLDEYERQEELEFRETIKGLSQLLRGEQPAVLPHGSGEAKGVDVSGVLKELELDLNDARVKEFASKKFTSETEAFKEGAKLIKSITSRQPTEADKPSGTSDRAKAAGKQEELMAEYREGAKSLRGTALINFKMQMRKKGLEIS